MALLNGLYVIAPGVLEGELAGAVAIVCRARQQRLQQRRAKLSVATLKKTLMESVVAAAASGGALLSFVFVA